MVFKNSFKLLVATGTKPYFAVISIISEEVIMDFSSNK